MPRENVADSGVSQFTVLSHKAGTPLVVDFTGPALALGRYLCFMFYRDQVSLLTSFPQLVVAFESAVRGWAAWGELLSGAYRKHGAGCTLMTSASRAQGGRSAAAANREGIGARGGHKTRGLGPEVAAGPWREMISVDGLGKVRAGEVMLYGFIAREFMKGIQSNVRSKFF